MSQHTPGPWSFKEGDRERRAMSDVFRAEDEGFQICYVTCEFHNDIQRAEDLANARLIAAAPDMYEALKEAEKRLRGAGMLGGLDDPVRAALAKVEGK